MHIKIKNKKTFKLYRQGLKTMLEESWHTYPLYNNHLPLTCHLSRQSLKPYLKQFAQLNTLPLSVYHKLTLSYQCISVTHSDISTENT